MKLQMDVLVTQLPTCVNREMIDKVKQKTKIHTQKDFFKFRLLVILQQILIQNKIVNV